MPVEHHDLVHELPEYAEQIHNLKMHNRHFRKLFDDYHALTRSVENMENEITPRTTQDEEIAKRERLRLKDELVEMIHRFQSKTA